MKKSGNFYRDITVGLFFIIGIFGFMSGEFVISTTLFATASILSNIHFTDQMNF